MYLNILDRNLIESTRAYPDTVFAIHKITPEHRSAKMQIFAMFTWVLDEGEW
jgi:hypothetical protein